MSDFEQAAQTIKPYLPFYSQVYPCDQRLRTALVSPSHEAYHAALAARINASVNAESCESHNIPEYWAAAEVADAVCMAFSKEIPLNKISKCLDAAEKHTPLPSVKEDIDFTDAVTTALLSEEVLMQIGNAFVSRDACEMGTLLISAVERELRS